LENQKGQAEQDFNKSVLANANEILAIRNNQIRKEAITTILKRSI